MENMNDYLRRKEEEIRFLNDQLFTPLAIPRPLGLDDIIPLKFQLRAALLTQTIGTNREMTETNSTPKPDWTCHGYTATYLYQRHNLQITGAPIYRDALEAIAADASSMREMYMASGMGALTVVLLALNRAVASPWYVVAFSDTYFETQHLIRQVASQMKPAVVSSAEDAIVALRSFAQVGDGGILLLYDSITAADNSNMIESLEPGSVDLILFDTTCYDSRSPRIRRVLERAQELALPIVLVRSHIKLDFLGVEYGRLGSASFFIPASTPERGVRLAEALMSLAADMTAVTGLMALPYHLPPGGDRPHFHEMNSRRLEKIMENNRCCSRYLAPLLASHDIHVMEYHHQLFLSIEFTHPLSHDTIKELVDDLQTHMEENGLPVRRATSFGFDFIAVADFVDVRRNRAVVRVALSDHPEPIVRRFTELLAAWCVERNILQVGTAETPPPVIPLNSIPIP